jgi:hypothetical protein
MPRPIMPHHPDSPEAKDMSCGCGGKGGGACGSKTDTALTHAGCGYAVKRGFCPLTALIMALLVGGGIAFAGLAIEHGVMSMSRAQRYVSMRGFAEQDVKADLALWNINYAATGDDLAAVQAKIETDTQTIRKLLADNGLGDDEIITLPLSMTDLLARDYRSEGANQARYIVYGALRVRTDKVDLVQKISGTQIGDLIRAGVTLRDNQQPPVYVYTKLKDVKPAMVAEATKDAKAAAATFANDSGATLGGIRQAQQGVFQILPRDQADGIYEAAEINKKVRVVTTVDYYLKD